MLPCPVAHRFAGKQPGHAVGVHQDEHGEGTVLPLVWDVRVAGGLLGQFARFGGTVTDLVNLCAQMFRQGS